MPNHTKSLFTGLIIITVLALTSAPATFADANWPQFRGADARGVSDGYPLPEEWSATKNVEWKTDIPGRGWSSPIVWDNKVFVTTVVNLAASEEPKKGLYFGGNRDAPDSVHQWKVLCLDLESGELLWERQVHEGKPVHGIHVKNSFASETPVTDGEHLYALFGNIGLYCFDFDGELVWKRDIEPNAMRFGWGTAASPALHEDRIYVVNDNDENSYLLALDKKTGEEIWRVARDEKSNWAPPFVWHNGQRTEIVTPGTGKVRSYDLDGKELWSLEGMSSITIALPYEFAGMLYISSGYVGDKHRPLYVIRPGAMGDISLKEDETANQWVAWSHPQVAPYNPSTLVYERQLFVLYDRGKVSSYEATAGIPLYENERLPRTSGFSASPWAYNGKIFCLSEDGMTFVLEAGDEFNLIATNTLAEDDMGMATPAIAGDRLLIRTSARIYSIRNEAAAGR